MGPCHHLHLQPGWLRRGLQVLPDRLAGRATQSYGRRNCWSGVVRSCATSKCCLPKIRVNLVFMGMGEPFLNYDNCMKAVRLLVEGVGIPESRMTFRPRESFLASMILAANWCGPSWPFR